MLDFSGVHPQWMNTLDAVSDRLSALDSFLEHEVASGHVVCPAPRHIFRALEQPMDGVRVVIVGQDPYPTPGHAMGLAFSVHADVLPLPRSLNNIFTELHNDVGVPRPNNGDLSGWAEQGVLLLNRVLTVREGAAASHHNRGWEQVTDHLIDALVQRDSPLIAVLWGNQAQHLRPRFSHENDSAIEVLTSPHPSPLSARRGFFGSRPFSRVDEFLGSHDLPPINWARTACDEPRAND